MQFEYWQRAADLSETVIIQFEPSDYTRHSFQPNDQGHALTCALVTHSMGNSRS